MMEQQSYSVRFFLVGSCTDAVCTAAVMCVLAVNTIGISCSRCTRRWSYIHILRLRRWQCLLKPLTKDRLRVVICHHHHSAHNNQQSINQSINQSITFTTALVTAECRNLDTTFVWRKNVGGIPHEVPTPNLAHTLVSACHKSRNICSYRLTTCYGLHQKTSFVSIRPHSSAHSGDSSTQCPTLPSWPASGRSLGRDWRRRPGRPRACWTDQLHNDTGSVPANLWRQAILRGHGGATRKPELARRWRRRVTGDHHISTSHNTHNTRVPACKDGVSC